MSNTNSFTSIDCIYLNFISKTNSYPKVIGRSYSFHEAIIFCVDTGSQIINAWNTIFDEYKQEVDVDIFEKKNSKWSKFLNRKKKKKESNLIDRNKENQGNYRLIKYICK